MSFESVYRAARFEKINIDFENVQPKLKQITEIEILVPIRTADKCECKKKSVATSFKGTTRATAWSYLKYWYSPIEDIAESVFRFFENGINIEIMSSNMFAELDNDL